MHLIRRHRILCNPLLVMIVWSLAHFFHYEGMLSFIWKEQWAGWFCKTVPPLLFSHLYAMAIQLLIRLSWAGDYSGLSKMNIFSIYYLIVFRTTSIFFLPYLYTCILFLHYLLFLIFFWFSNGFQYGPQRSLQMTSCVVFFYSISLWPLPYSWLRLPDPSCSRPGIKNPLVLLVDDSICKLNSGQ